MMTFLHSGFTCFIIDRVCMVGNDNVEVEKFKILVVQYS